MVWIKIFVLGFVSFLFEFLNNNSTKTNFFSTVPFSVAVALKLTEF